MGKNWMRLLLGLQLPRSFHRGRSLIREIDNQEANGHQGVGLRTIQNQYRRRNLQCRRQDDVPKVRREGRAREGHPNLHHRCDTPHQGGHRQEGEGLPRLLHRLGMAQGLSLGPEAEPRQQEVQEASEEGQGRVPGPGTTTGRGSSSGSRSTSSSTRPPASR